jgi:hypothetical protein
MPTKIEYIKECKEEWRTIKASGLSKEDWLDTDEGKVFKAKGYKNNCPLCEGFFNYFMCKDCPLMKQYGDDCGGLGFDDNRIPRDEWFEAIEGLEEK